MSNLITKVNDNVDLCLELKIALVNGLSFNYDVTSRPP